MVNLYLENSTAPIDVAEDNARYRVLVVPETSRFGGTIVSIRMDAIFIYELVDNTISSAS